MNYELNKNGSFSLRPARPDEAEVVAKLIMEAMSDDCCQWFAGPDHTLSDFHRLMTELVERIDSQYSYLNTAVAVCDGQVVGVCVTYDGARLHELRRAFIEGALRAFGMDYSGMGDETQAGELYIDSLCVARPYRRRGIASALIQDAIQKASSLGLPAVGLLVDKGNPQAEQLYSQLGFMHVGDNIWGSHPMRHLTVHSSFNS